MRAQDIINSRSIIWNLLDPLPKQTITFLIKVSGDVYIGIRRISKFNKRFLKIKASISKIEYQPKKYSKGNIRKVSPWSHLLMQSRSFVYIYQHQI